MITIKEVRIDNVGIKYENGKFKIQGDYCLLSEKGKTVAKQGFNGYDNLKVDMDRETESLLEEFIDNLRLQIEISTGVQEAVRELKGGK